MPSLSSRLAKAERRLAPAYVPPAIDREAEARQQALWDRLAAADLIPPYFHYLYLFLGRLYAVGYDEERAEPPGEHEAEMDRLLQEALAAHEADPEGYRPPAWAVEDFDAWGHRGCDAA